MKRFISVLLCLFLVIAMFSGCSSTPTNVRILSIENSAAATLAHMLEKSEGDNNYISSTVNLPNRVRNLIADGECDIAVVPIETASLIYQRGLTDIKLLAGISTGGFELVSTENITDYSTLKGKTIYLTERGTLMESILKYLLSYYNIDPFEDVTFDYASDAKQLEKMLANGTASFALLSSANAASAKVTVKNLISLNITDGLKTKLEKPSIITYCVIGKADFVSNNADAIEQLLKDIETSVKSSGNLSNTVSKAKKLGLLTDDIYKEDFISSYKPDFISGEAMKTKLSAYYKLVLKVNLSLIGNKAPSDDFYYLEEK